MNEPASMLPASELMDRISFLGRDIRDILRSVIDQLSHERVRPQALARSLNLNKSLTSKLLIALEFEDPLAALQAMPGPVPLRSVLDAAEAQGVGQPLLVGARRAVDQFDQFLEEHFDDRGELDVLLGASLYDIRVKSESAAKQAAFRGNVGLMGVVCDVTLSAFMAHPAADQGPMCDMALMGGITGMRRLRPGVVVEHTVHKLTGAADGMRDADPLLPLVRGMCRPANLPLEVVQEDQCATYRLLGEGIGRRSAVSFIVREHWPAAFSRAQTPGGPARRFFGATISQQPSRRLVLDAILHESIWPQQRPELFIYNLACHGPIRAGDPKQAQRRMQLAESIQLLGNGTSCARHADLPGYVEAINETAALHGWNPREFRVYRCEILYPLFGSQISMGFDVEPAA